MKYIAVLIAFLIAFSAANAQHNAAQNQSQQVQVKVITPFLVEDATPNGNQSIPDVIKGQTRTFTPSEQVYLFDMYKESNYKVRFTLTMPQPVGGVSCDANWYFEDTDPYGEYDFPNTPLSSTWDWFDSQHRGWIYLKVHSVDASGSGVVPGIVTFTAGVSGHYVNL